MVTLQALGREESFTTLTEPAGLLSESPFCLVPQKRSLEGIWALDGKKLGLSGKLEPKEMA